MRGALLMLIACAFTSGDAQNRTVPLCPGLTIVTALAGQEGDYESIKVIDRIDAAGVHVRYSSEAPPERLGSGFHVRKLNETRTIRQSDLRSARLYLHWYGTNVPVEAPGTTGLGASSLVLTSLKSSGRADLGMFSDMPGGTSRLPWDRSQHPNIFDFTETYELHRGNPAIVKLPVIVNDVRTELPAIHAIGQSEFYKYRAEFFFLDDESNPLALKWRTGIAAGSEKNKGGDRESLNVIKISYQCTNGPSEIERKLIENGRADVYSIYFSFNSNEIREESEPTLREIAQIMRRHPDWKLNIAGHTDSIGGDAFNLDLSKRRGTAVTNALVSSFGINTSRLSSNGYGRSRPVETNDTEEGRARNRRVELTRR